MVEGFSMENLSTIQDVVLEEKPRIHSPELRLFREYMDNHYWTSKRDEVLCKLLYLTGARASEILCKTTPFQLTHGMSKPYGRLMRWELGKPWKKHIVFDDGKTSEETPLLLVTLGIAKMKLRKQQPTETSPNATLHPITYSGIPTKDVAIPLDPKIEPWCSEIAQWIHKMKLEKKLQNGKPKLSFDMTESNLGLIVKKNLKDLMHLDPKITSVHPHSLRHWRIDHLRLNYGFDSIQVCAFIGWSIQNEAAKRGQKVSSNIDVYSHLSYRDYCDRLIQPLSDIL
jgi:hypothetical protein